MLYNSVNIQLSLKTGYSIHVLTVLYLECSADHVQFVHISKLKFVAELIQHPLIHTVIKLKLWNEKSVMVMLNMFPIKLTLYSYG